MDRNRIYNQFLQIKIFLLLSFIIAILLGCTGKKEDKNPINSYPDGEIIQMTWESTGGGDIKFTIVPVFGSYNFAIHVQRIQFQLTDELLYLSPQDTVEYGLVSDIFDKERNVYNDTYTPDGPTGSWTSITLYFTLDEYREIENISPTSELQAIADYVRSHITI